MYGCGLVVKAAYYTCKHFVTMWIALFTKIYYK